MKRELRSELMDYMLGKLKDNSAFQAARSAKNKSQVFRPIMIYGGQTLVGVREATGKNDGRMIELIQDTVGGADRAPYCMSGYQTLLAFAEELTGIKSPLIATELCTALWYDTKKNKPDLIVRGLPAPGAAALWRDIKKGKPAISGHVECVTAAYNTAWEGIGFNTSGSAYPGGPVVREGNGVYLTKRDYSDKPNRELLGFIKPI
jgi:hypothetical protein